MFLLNILTEAGSYPQLLCETTQNDHNRLLYKFENDQKNVGCVGSCGYAPASFNKSRVLLRHQITEHQLSRQIFVRKLLIFSLLFLLSNLKYISNKCFQDKM